jgi:septal ring factor EnvC (AmiA/AmiB activator)
MCLAVFLQVCQQQEVLHQHTSQLADAKQELQQQLTALLEQQDQLQHHKQQLQQQVQLLQEQQEEHLGDKLQLQHRIEQLQASQQQLQETSAQLAVEVGAATDKLQQQSTCPSTGAANHAPSGSSSTSQQHQGDSVGGATGDLKLQLTVPGFTDALVTRIGEAELVPKFAEALVNQVCMAAACMLQRTV